MELSPQKVEHTSGAGHPVSVGSKLLRDLFVHADAFQAERALTDQQMADRAGMMREQYARVRKKAHDEVGDVELHTVEKIAAAIGFELRLAKTARGVGLGDDIRCLDMRSRTQDILRRARIDTVQALICQTPHSLRRLRGFGVHSVRDVEQALAVAGWRLSDSGRL